MTFKKGYTPWNKGKKTPENVKKKISESLKGREPWNKGRKWPEHSERMKGRVGKDASNWKGGRMISGRGYVFIYNPDHPAANELGYIREHRLVAENIIGRYLTSRERVHHINGDIEDNRPENLYIFPSDSEHSRYHANLQWGNKVEKIISSNLEEYK